jgi:large subunit ribosomal protein L16
MGKGKGDIEGYCARVLAGQVMFEVDGALAPVAVESLRKGGTKMPVKTKVVARE